MTRWIVAFVLVALLGWVTLNTVTSDSAGSKGLPAGARLPPFAMPLASSSCRGRCDANVALRSGQGAAGERPACTVRRPDVLNSCELAERGPVVLAFVFAPVGECRDQLGVLERVRARHPGVAFAAIDVRADGAAARRFVREGGWTLPVGYDHDAAVADEYGVVVCPTLVFARRGGAVLESTAGPQSEAEVERRVRRLEAVGR
ncbi:TlpA family protein disulfide reductase [Candidatus Solirubrobacter pratensis]|uniref:TlpA family protein disulfide reductase n=1 Tax=Candidatus Solirubrobacter pratensis TaxID=1298857 RepID=UPI000483CD18|nr:TlpA disulfide reductase family protein [Candidatus Solirubrobacter pratensis]